ncbi:Oxoglutarate/iron-dependent dioxygenase [uncultured Caudovirales phage]|uniref:Oxoglutarate/iron-dependent dioxygenase n=1 Tax=uncultured Caudovirales phage TaxID=2100421 RepID=A0A6J7WVC1_9CAUD|nr:Oxoglutarate/iron-dependent dioxygenase [uncultured Caudovirales phage]
MITKTLSSGKEIIIIDNLFKPADCMYFETFANKCNYTLKGSVSAQNSSRSDNELFFGADLSRDDMTRFRLFDNQEFKNINFRFNNLVVLRSWILCTEPSTKYLYHPDHLAETSLTFLYYLNGFWHPEWGGETLFCDDNGEPELAVMCKPNRAVIFPSCVFHKPSGTSRDSKLRFTFTTTFVKNEPPPNV